MIMEMQNLEKDALEAGQEYRFEMIERRLGRGAVAEAEKIGEAPGSEVLRTTCVHIVDDERIALERRLIMLAAVPNARYENFDIAPPGSWLLEQVPWSQARHVIRAVGADAATAKLLGLSHGKACLLLCRETWQNGAAVTYVELTYPGDKHQFVGTFASK